MEDIKELYSNIDKFDGKEVSVQGWVKTVRDSKTFGFIELNDGSFFKNIQIVFDDTTEKELFAKAETIRSEYVLAVKGKVRERSSKTDKIATGAIEILDCGRYFLL